MHYCSGPLRQKVAAPGVTVPDGNTDFEEPFTNIPHLHIEPLPEAKSFGSLGSGSTTLDGMYTDTEELYTTIPHLHVEPLPEAKSFGSLGSGSNGPQHWMVCTLTLRNYSLLYLTCM
jgi:hypothetical protein